jgi:Trp operon repressor
MDTWKKTLEGYKKNRQKIYKEWLKGKTSKRQLAIKYGISNTRVGDIIKTESKAVENFLK